MAEMCETVHADGSVTTKIEGDGPVTCRHIKFSEAKARSIQCDLVFCLRKGWLRTTIWATTLGFPDAEFSTNKVTLWRWQRDRLKRVKAQLQEDIVTQIKVHILMGV